MITPSAYTGIVRAGIVQEDFRKMLFGSHYHIGSLVYRFIVSKYIPYSPVDKILFQAGNILPDFSNQLSKLEHSPEGSSKPFKYHTEKVQDTTLSSGERMVSLGILCHYLTDFFCTYHTKEPFRNRSLVRHLFYEFRLHLVFLAMLFSSGRLVRQILSEEADSSTLQDTVGLLPDADRDTADLQVLLFSLQKEYHTRKPAIATDIRFALKATLFSTTLLMKDFAVVKAPAPRMVFDIVSSYNRFASSPRLLAADSLHRSR